MAKKLARYTLGKDARSGEWVLRSDATKRVAERFATKADAVKGGALEKALGRNGGTVRIQKLAGGIQEERTFPGDRDPHESKG